MPFDDDQEIDLDTWEKRVFEKHGIPEGLRMSIRNQESGGDVNATSPTGVKGRYQVTQGAAKQFGLNRDDPWEQPVAAAKLLRQNYDNAKTRNPKFSDRQAWLAASASYYAGSDAFDASGNLSTGSKDGLSNPSRYAESIAKRWSDFERGQVKPEQPFLSADQPSPLQRSIQPGTQKTTVRGPVRPVQLNPFSLAAPDIVGDAAAIAGRISPEVAAEADRAGRELARFQSRSRIGQLGEVAAGGLMQGVDQTVKAASYVNPLPMASAFRGRGALTPAAAQNLQAQQSAQDVALPNTAPIVRGTVAAGVQLPAIAMAGPAAPLVAGGLAASSADWRDPKRAALQTAIGLAGGAAGGKLAQMAIRPATMGGRLASGAAGGAAGNVIPTAVEQLAYEGKLNPQQLAQQAVIGAATGAALPPGVDPRSGGRQPVQGGESPGQIRAKYARPRGTPLSDTVATVDAIQAERTPTQRIGEYDQRTDRLPEGWGGEQVRGTEALPESVRLPSNPLDINQANASEAKINASQAENLGDWTRARTEYDTAHAAMVRMRRALGRTPGAEDEISALDREISAADLNRKRAARQILATEREQRAASRVRPAARQQDAVENAPTADLPSETNPLLKSVVNPEGGIPAAEESPSGLFGQLARQQAAGQAKPARGAKGSGQLSAVEYLKRASNGEGIRVSDRGEARVLGAKEAGIVGLTNKSSQFSTSDAQVMLDEGGFSLQDGRKFTDPSVTENDVLSFLTEFGREGRMNTRDLDNRIEQESADYYANQPPSEPLRAASNRLPRIGDLPPSRVSRNLQPEKPEIPRGTDRPLTVTEQARQAGGSTEDLARLDQLNRQLAAEEPRPYGERTRPGEPGSGGRSLSPYADMMANNKQAFDQLEKMDLESPEAGEILARIDDYVERRRIDPVHLERKLNAIRGDQAREAGLTDREIGSAPLRRTSTSELQDFYSRPDETPAKSEPLKPVRGVRAPESVKEAAPVEPEPQAAARNPHHVSLDTAASDKTNRVDVRKWVAVAKDESRKPDARKNAVKRLMSLTGIRDPEQMRAALQDYEFPMTATDRDVAAMSEENLTRAIETSDTQSARRIREGSPTSPQDVERSKALNDERRHRVAMGAMKSLYEKRPGRGNEDVATFTDDVLAKRIRDAEKILNNPGLSEARAQQIEDFLTGAEKERDSRAAKSRTVSHPDPAINGKPIVGETQDGRVIVANPENKTGVSVVKPDRAPVKYAIPEEAMPELRKPDLGVSRERGDQPPPMPDRVTARDLADNVRAEYRPAKNRPGTVYLNDWGLEALNAAHSIEFADASASGSDRITGGVNYKPERARILAEHIRDRAERPNFTPEGRKNLETMARQIELAADDGAVSIVPMVGQGMGKAKQTIRHEAFHAQQSTISPKIHELTTPRWLPAQKFGAKIGEELGRLGYEKHEHPAEAAAYVASGDWGRFGMSKADARQFLTDYFDDVAYRHGKEAINKFRAIHPELQDVVEARRGTNEPRFGSPGLGRSAEPAISRQRGIEGPGGIAARSRSGVPGGDTGRVPRQSPTAGLRAITPESLRAQSGAGAKEAQPRAAESPRRPGLAGIRAEDLRAPATAKEKRAGRAARREPVKPKEPDADYGPKESDKPAGFWAKLSDVRKAGLLSGPKTHIVNMLGNTTYQVTEELSRIPAGIVDMALSKATGRRSIAGANLMAMARSSKKAATDGVREAAQIMKTGIPKETAEKLQLEENKFTNPILKGYTQFVFRALGAEDQIFKTYAMTRSLESQAKAMAINDRRAGKIGRGDVKSRMEAYRDNPTNEMSANAIADAEVATFQNDNKLSSAVRAGRGQIGEFGNFAVDLFLPFDRTPTNIIARTLEMTPLGFGKTAKQLAEAVGKKSFDEKQQREFAQTFGRASTGSALIYLGYALAAQGVMTGLADPDPRKRAKQEAIAPPASIKIGGRWYQVGKFAPAGALMGLGATIHRDSKAGKGKGDMAISAATGMARIGLELPHLRAAKEVSDLSRTQTIPGKAGRLVGSFVPTIISNVGDLIDPSQRDTKTFLGGLGSRVPGARQLLPVRKDARGRVIKTEKSDVIDPFNSRPVRP